MDANDIFARFERKAAAADSLTYLRFSKGDFLYGGSDEEMDNETKFVADMHTMTTGWICWINGEKVDEISVPVLQGDPPPEEDLPDHTAEYMDAAKDGWSPQSTFKIRELEDLQRQFMFKGSSKGVSGACSTLCKEFITEGRKRNDPTLCPVIVLEVDSYPHKQFGRIKFPVFKVVDWMTKAEAEAHFRMNVPKEVTSAIVETPTLTRRPAQEEKQE